MTLLQQMERQSQETRERDRHQARKHLREVLRKVIPAQPAYVFGSIVKPGRFTPQSDIDLALEFEPAGMSIFQLISVLSEEMDRPVDVVLLSECRLKAKILREGERWTPQD